MSSYATIGHDIETNHPVTIGDIERRSGLYILGKPGMGKSTMLLNLMNHDLLSGHGLFFLDPHGEAINDLINRCYAIPYATNNGYIMILDPADETHSFGINLLACKNIHSLTERQTTYTRARDVFKKLFEQEWGEGAWMQLIIQNVLQVFIENQEYTLAEVPLFLRNSEFRDYLISNVKYNQEAVDFWNYEFKPIQAQAVLTRIRTLLVDPYVKHIIGQQKTSIDFVDYVRSGSLIMLVRLSANLAPDTKKFIGTILISELLHAVKNRPMEWRQFQFSIFVDEFQNFTSSDDFATLITEARKFGVATTIAHQERFGQFSEDKKIQGATSAAANKIFFQTTVRDAQELAPEFAEKPDDTKTRVGGELVISPHAVEDIWERGHTEERIMDIRRKYFWLVDLLRTKPQEKYFEFNPDFIPYAASNDTSPLNYSKFDDWGEYRSSFNMLREGISLLNEYYYNWMQTKPFTANNYRIKLVTDKELQLMLRVIDCLGGVLGFRPTMLPYIPLDMQYLYVKRLNEREKQTYEERIRNAPRSVPPPQRNWSIEDIPTWLMGGIVSGWREFAINVGFSASELEQFIQWEERPLKSREYKSLVELVRIFANITTDKETYEREWPRVYREYTAIMSVDPLIWRFEGKDYNKLPDEVVMPYLRIVTERIVWQMTELRDFINECFRACPMFLEGYPVKVPSGKYDETPKRERTQAEMIDMMTQELVDLERFTAYAKVIQEHGGRQLVIKRKIKTMPMLPMPEDDFAKHFENIEARIIDNTHKYYCKERSEIENEIRQRQEKWRSHIPDSSRRSPPFEEPPPTFY